MSAPILKWPGSKRARAAQLAGYFGTDRRPVYCEPFLGSGSVAVLHASYYGMAVLGDAAPRLIPTYRAVVRDPSGVGAALAGLPGSVQAAGQLATELRLVSAQRDTRAGQHTDPWKAYFYDHRDRVVNAWKPAPGEVASPALAAHYVWHRQGGFNGLIRTGPNGDNTTAGDRLHLPNPRDLEAFGYALRHALLADTDFEATTRAALTLGAVDLFLDPPYAGDYAGYTADGFKDEDRDRLAGLARDVVAQRGRVLVTEADHPEAWRWLTAAGQHVRPVVGKTSISRSGDQRGAKQELIARSWAW